MSAKIQPKLFSETFAMLIDGDADLKLADEFAAIVRAVDETKKSGKLTISISVARDVKTVTVVVDSKVTIPKEKMEASSFFIDDQGGVHREDPRQSDLWDPPRRGTAFPGDD